MDKALAPVTDVILGRTIYDEWSGYFAGNDEDFGAFINPVAKHVASRTLQDPLEWNNSTVIPGDADAQSPMFGFQPKELRFLEGWVDGKRTIRSRTDGTWTTASSDSSGCLVRVRVFLVRRTTSVESSGAEIPTCEKSDSLP